MSDDDRPIEDYVRACEAKGCCPLGAAWKGIDPDGPRNPFPYLGVPLGPLTQISRRDAFEVIDLYDGPPGDTYRKLRDRPGAIRRALAAGLGPAMARYLFVEPATPQEDGA